MRKILAILLSLSLLLGCLPAAAAAAWSGDAAAAYAGGTGMQDDPYRIETGEQLAYLSAQVAAGESYADAYFALTADLDMGNQSFTPIGSSSAQFRGTFDGKGHTVNNLKVEAEQNYAGLFGYVGIGGAIRGVTVRGSVSGKGYLGGVVGYINQGTVENCANYAAVTGTGTYVGGIVGNALGSSGTETEVLRCYNAGAVTSGTSNHAGGVVGFSNHVNITECYNTGAISGKRVGGIVAQTSAAVTACYNVGEVTLTEQGTYNYMGDLVGYLSGTVDRCYILAGKTAIGFGDSGGYAAVTDAVMKSVDTVTGLGGSFVEDKGGLNNGYPILGWQDPTAKFAVVFDVNLKGAAVTVRDAEEKPVEAEPDGSYRLTSGEYTYTVTLDECEDVSGRFTVAGTSLRISVTLVKKTYPLTLKLTPPDAALRIFDADLQEQTPQDGAYRLPKGRYTYEASKFGYLTRTGEFAINGANDTLELVLTEAARYEVRFSVLSASGEPISDAQITVSHATGGEQTAQDGVYRLPDGEYRYHVSAEGYLGANGTFTVSGVQETVEVRMQRGSDVWTGGKAEEPPATEQSGETTYYLITNGEELEWFRAQAETDPTICGKLMANIVLNSEDEPTKNQWAGIGGYSKQYTGTFDGNGKRILGYSSVYDESSYSGGVGLFAYLGKGAIVKNLTLEGSIVADGAVGTIANQSYGRIEGCVSRVTIQNNPSYGGVTGGIVGRAYQEGAIVNCGNEGDLTCVMNSAYSDAKVGGIVGECYCAILNCYNTGNIDGGGKNSGKVAGISGYTNNGDSRIENCYNTGDITGTSYVAGIAARHTMGSAPSIQNCYNTGTITATAASPNYSGAIAGDLYGNPSAEAVNVHYLTGSAGAAVGNVRDGMNIEAVEQTAETMQSREFVLTLGNDAFAWDTEKQNGGYPVLAWQGGEHVVDSETATALSAAREALTVEPTTVREPMTLVLPTEIAGFAGTVTWASSDEGVITTSGAVTLPEDGTVYVTLTATLTLKGEQVTKQFVITVISLAAQNMERLGAAQTYLNAHSALHPDAETDGNLCDFVVGLLDAEGCSGIAVAVENAGTVSYPIGVGTAGIAENGDLTYFKADPNALEYAVNNAVVQNVVLRLSRGGQSLTVSVTVTLDWDVATVQAYLAQAAEKITFESIRGENADAEHITQDMTLPQTVEGSRFVRVAWESDSEILEITGEPYADTATAHIRKPAEDTPVRLTPTLTFTLSDGTLRAEGFALTVPGENLDALREQMQRELNENYLVTKLNYIGSGEPVDPAAVYDDIQLLTPRNTGIANYDDYRFEVVSDRPEVIRINAYRAVVYQPMPGEDPVTVTLTVTMRHKEKDVSVEKEIELTVVPLTVEELDAALKLMDAAKAHYWDGINDGANASIYGVTENLHAFYEVTMADDGTLNWVYQYKQTKEAGIVPGDLADFTLGGQEAYNHFRSSNPAVVSHENLLVTQPDYNTSVTVDSILEHARYAKYAETETGAWYDNYFSKLVNQPASATMTVLGRFGGGSENPPTDVTVKVRLTGVNEIGAVDTTVKTTSDKTVEDVLRMGLGEDYTLTVSPYGFVGTLTGSDAFNEANADVDFWGQYYYVDGAYDTASDLNTTVRDGGVYAIFADEKATLPDNYYGYKYSVWFHETALEAKAGEDFTVTVYQMAGSSALPQAGVTVYQDGAPLGTTDQDGRLTCRFAESGVYVLNLGDGNHTYSRCVVTVTGETQQPDPEKPDPPKPERYTITWLVDGKATQTVCEKGETPAFPGSTEKADDRFFTYTFTGWSPEVVPAAADATYTARYDRALRHFASDGRFVDVSDGEWFYSAVYDAAGLGLFGGTSANTFAPRGEMTRGMLVTVLWRLEGQPAHALSAFRDVRPTAYYAEAIGWAAENGIVNGIGDGCFAPEEPVTREQMVTILYRYSAKRGLDTEKTDDLGAFPDAGEVGRFAGDAVRWAVAEGLLKGSDGRLLPKDGTSRAEVAAIFLRFIETLL